MDYIECLKADLKDEIAGLHRAETPAEIAYRKREIETLMKQIRFEKESNG